MLLSESKLAGLSPTEGKALWTRNMRPRTSYDNIITPMVYKDLVKTVLVGDLQTELVQDFFDGFVNHAGANLHAKVLYGRSNHHKIEAIFKCFARAMRYACSKDARLKKQLPSTKGLL